MLIILLFCFLSVHGELATVNVFENSNFVLTAEPSSDPDDQKPLQVIINLPSGTKLTGRQPGTGNSDTVEYSHGVEVNAPRSSQIGISAGQAEQVPPCDADWNHLGATSSCYKLISDGMQGFHASEDLCVANGAHLVSVTSMDEFTFVRGMIDGALGAGYPGWIGLHTNNCQLEWTDGTTQRTVPGVTTCFPDPIPCDPEMCVVSAPQPHHFFCAGGHFGATMCNGIYPVVCKKPQYGDLDECRDNNGGCSQLCVNTAESHECQCKTGFYLAADRKTCVESLGSCERGWTFFENSCYLYQWNFMDSFTNAESYCQQGDAHLASVKSYSQMQFIKNGMDGQIEEFCMPAWIGMKQDECGDMDIQCSNTWSWIADGSPVNAELWREYYKDTQEGQAMAIFTESGCTEGEGPTLMNMEDWLPSICQKAPTS